MQIITADFIYTPLGFVENQLLIIDDVGKIIEFRAIQPNDNSKKYEGILCPAFVNAHCHLELSALKGEIPTHTGMTGFAGNVAQKRSLFTPEQQQQAISISLENAYQTGTIAFGDICNSDISVYPKKNNVQRFHFQNFIELFGMRESAAEMIWENGKMLMQTFQNENLSANLTLHAPYSLSKALKAFFYEYIAHFPMNLLSFHLLESKAEREIFEKSTGEFAHFYQQIGIEFKGFETAFPLDFVLNPLPKSQPFLAVHTTEITENELISVANNYPNSFFCLCPRSNLYIHNTFPNVPMYLAFEDRICLGTDSLASNWDLNMLEEAKAIEEKYPEIGLHTLIKWLTTNGAKALQIDDWAGSFEVGKKCGVVRLQCEKENSLLGGFEIQRII